MEIVKKRAETTIAKLSDLVSQAKELKIDWGLSIWPVSKGKKDIKSKCAALVSNKERLRGCLGNRGEETRQGREDLKPWAEDEHRFCHLSKRQQEHECELRKGKTRRRTTCSGQEIRDREKPCFQHYKMTKIEDYTVEIWKHVSYTSWCQVDFHQRKIAVSSTFCSPEGQRRNSIPKAWNLVTRLCGIAYKRNMGIQRSLSMKTWIKSLFVSVKRLNYFRVQEFCKRLSRNHDALQTLQEAQKLRIVSRQT